MRHLLGPVGFLVLTTVTPFAIASSAHAHIGLVYPPSRNPSPLNQQKTAPCGLRGAPRGETVEIFEPGATITVRWDETINHPSHYRIAFDSEGQDDLAPPVYDEVTSTWSSPPGVLVLADDITDSNGGSYEMTVTLPEIECENCVLQLIQVMYDKPPYDGGNDHYYHCSDIALRASGADGGSSLGDGGSSLGDGALSADSGVSAVEDRNGACGVGRGGHLGWLESIFAFLPLAMWLRRRRARAF